MNKLRWQILGFLLAIGPFLIASCATVKTSPALKENPAEGVLYFLPKRRVKVDVKGTPAPTDLQEKIISAKEALAKVEEALKAATAEHAAAQELLESVKKEGDAEATKKVNTDVILAKVKKDTAKENRDKARKELSDLEAALAAQLADLRKEINFAKKEIKRTEDALSNAEKSCDGNKIEEAKKELKGAKAILSDLKARVAEQACPMINYTITVSLLELEPDPEHTYVANLSHNVLRDDTLKIETTPEGLLTSADVTAADRTVDIIIDIARSIASFYAPVAIPGAKAAVSGRDCLPAVTFADIIDPAGHQPDDINCRLKKAHIPFRLGWEPVVRPSQFHTNKVDNEVSGLLYRRPIPYLFYVERYDPNRKEESWIRDQASIVLLRNKGPIGYVPLKAHFGVTTTDKVVFKEGLLTKWDASKPSEIAAVVRIPATLVKTYLSTLSEIIQLRFNITSKETELLKAQKALLEALKELEKTRAGQNPTSETAP